MGFPETGRVKMSATPIVPYMPEIAPPPRTKVSKGPAGLLWSSNIFRTSVLGLEQLLKPRELEVFLTKGYSDHGHSPTYLRSRPHTFQRNAQSSKPLAGVTNHSRKNTFALKSPRQGFPLLASLNGSHRVVIHIRLSVGRTELRSTMQ